MKIIWAIAAIFYLATGVTFASEPEKTVAFDVKNMTCATCPVTVRKAMQRVEGVREVDVSSKNNSAVVSFDPTVTTADEIGRASTAVGFPATEKSSE